MKENKVARSVQLPQALVEKIQQDADEKCCSFNAIVRKILTDYYDNKNK